MPNRARFFGREGALPTGVKPVNKQRGFSNLPCERSLSLREGRPESPVHASGSICPYVFPVTIISLYGWLFQGGFDYKKAIVDTIITIIEENSEAKEAGKFCLSQLAASIWFLYTLHAPSTTLFEEIKWGRRRQN